ncbi:hypothetical protein CJD36_015345 [Flavipsychrobacter stenotrophus]|uniref:Alpha-2-macroglobulin n=1 Tax=Flavipsychrobacter stenotrophus TaxID=2077091 RepID=A0A2S7ST09_9BACT|nr:Ig-like domain-containing alpha-2-macroglobulin family protein [Flavipsychrobacter stenotrophus]PQJ10072.1 hypothetical protein CJD36_015345 [Flavipsychrobacter stenotrophus]
MKPGQRQIIAGISCLFVCVLLYACKTSKFDLQVTKNFETEIEQQQNLEFTFSKDIYPDSLLNRWDTAAFVEITPKVKGKFKWNSSNMLSFSPAEGFTPGTEYTAKLTKEIVRYSKTKLSFDDAPIHFHTAELRVTEAHVSWMRGTNVANIMVQLDMSFNYEVNLGEVVNRLRLNSGGNNVTINTANTGNGKTLSVQFMPVNDKDEETPLKVQLDKGIPIVGAKYTSLKDTAFTVGIPSRYNLTVTGIVAQHTGTEGIITVSTSQPVVETNLKNMISMSPAVDFDVTVCDGGFIVSGAKLIASQLYTMTIKTGIEGSFGGKMKSDHTEQIAFGKLHPSISFVNTKGMYLSSAGYKNLLLNIVNVPTVEVCVIKVYENNLEAFMRTDKDYNYHYDEKDDEGTSYQFYQTENLGDTIFHQTYETAKLPAQNAARLLHLDFEDRVKGYNGVYVVMVRSKEQNWIQESKIIAISDIGIIVKEEKDNIYVFTNSIRTAAAMPGVNVSFISSNNQKLATVTTDADGVAIFKNISQSSPGFKVAMVTARKGDEFSFVWFSKTQIGTSRFDVGGRNPNETGLIAMIYPERNIYRPGETIHVSTIVRSEQWQQQTEVPVKLKLSMPNGKEFATVQKILNEQGSCEAQFPTPPTAITGNYLLEVFTGNNVLLNSYNISVEEFMPDRMKVGVTTPKKEYAPGENVVAQIQADNLFGTPAAGRNYSCEMNLAKTTFPSEKYPDYNFELRNDFNFNTDIRQGKTDDRGGATETFKLDANLTNSGILNGNIMATVFDETGRPVHRYEHFTVYAQSVYAGVKCDQEYITTRLPVKMGLIALDKREVPQNATAVVSVIKKEWHTVIQQNGNGYRYVSANEDKQISTQVVQISGTNAAYTFTPQQSGEYEVRVAINGSNTYVAKTLYAYGWNDAQYSSFEVNNEGNVEIKTDKKEYNTGETVKALFTAPFEGKMLVTIERDHIIKYYYLNTKNKSAALSFPVDDASLPNVYITATLFRPMDGSDMPLTVGHGFKNVRVTNKTYNIPVTITIAEKSRSRTRQTINIKTAPGAFVTVAAVDEGILQVKNFATPDPYDYFYQKVTLSINSYDIYPWLLPEIKTRQSSTGGDGAESNSGRVNPMFVNRVKNVSFWSGILQADSRGNVKYDIDIPQFSGDIRVMALAYKNKSFGSQDKHMKVADPIVISTALPRFLTPKDDVTMSVSMSNTTGNTATAYVTVQTSGPLGVQGSATQTVQIPANREGRAIYNIVAQPSIGVGKVTVTVKAFNETFTNETDISIRPPASLQKLTGYGVAGENRTTPIDITNKFIPTSVAGKLIVSKSPLTQFSKHLEDLVRYPYGCVEQTVSAAFPQLYYADLVKGMNNGTNTELNPASNVQQAIIKLQSMQQGDGGMSYWPEGGGESWWGSIYACHFMLEAKKAGFDVNAHTLQRLQEYMKYRMYKKETVTFYYNGTAKKEVAPEEIAYSLYVLAMAGQSQQSDMNYYKAHQELLTLDSKYMLAAAYALSGQPSQAKGVMPPAFTGEIPNHTFGGSFNSQIRDEALSLLVMLDIDPNNRQVGILARQLSEQLRKERYLSTQENSFSMLALGKIMKIANQTTATATVTANNKSVGTTTGQPLNVNMKAFANAAMNVQVKGNGGYYYFWELNGITADGSYKEEDNFIKVRRTYYDRQGRETKTFKQNDLIVIRISIEGQYDTKVENVAITDMLPAGFEVENTLLNEMPKMEWIKEPAKADYMDIRDDRINMFTTVERKRKDFYYMVRAVSPGTFQLGPVQADAMYDGNYHSYNGAGIIKVTN